MPIFKKRRRDYHGMTYHVDPKRLKKRERSSKWRKFLNRVYSVIILGTLLWLAYFVLFTPFFMLKEVELLGPSEEAQDEIMSKINEFLSSKKYWIFHNKNYFIFNKEKLDECLREKFFLSELEISKKFPKKLIVELKERVSTLNLCVGKDCFLVDYVGKVIARVEEGELGQEIPLVYYRLEDELEEEIEPAEIENDGNESNEKELPRIVVGMTEIPTEKVRAILDLFELLSKAALRPGSLRARASEPRAGSSRVEIISLEIYSFDGLTKKIAVNTKEGFKVYFNEENDLKEQVWNLNLILNREIISNIDNIKYIDLRFGNKIFYK